MGINDFRKMRDFSNLSLLKCVCYIIIAFSLIEIMRNSFSSLWLDELTTIWVIEDSFKEVFSRSFNYQGQSPLYYLIVKSFTSILGVNDFSIRLPSVIAALFSLAIFYKLAREIIGVPASLVSVSLLGINQEFLFQSANARPYSILIAIFLLCIWLLRKWTKQQNAGTLIALSFWSVILFYMHYLYASAVSFLFLTLLCRRLYDKKALSSDIIIATVITCLFCLPAVPHLLSLASKSRIYEFAPEPEIREIVYALLVPEVSIYSLSFLITYAFFKIIGKIQAYKNNFTLNVNKVTGNALTPIIMIIFPVSFFILTWWLSGISNFINRYFLWNLPAKILLAGLLVSTLSKESAKVLFLLLCVVLSIITSNNSMENWRDAVAEIRNEAGSSTILIYSGLIESQSIFWHDREKSEYFTTPVRYYWPDNRNRLVPLPIFLESNEQKEYLGGILSDLRIQGDEFYLIARLMGINNKASTEILKEKLVHNGFKEIKSKDYEGVSISKWRSIKDN